jgi:outer membrane protein
MLAANPSVAAAAQTAQAAGARVDQARAPFWPQLALNSSYSHSTSQSQVQVRQPIPGATELVNRTVTNISSSASGYLSLSHTLFDFDKRSSALNASEQSLLASLQSYEQARQAALLTLRQAYFAVVTAQESLVIYRQALQAQEQHLQQSQGFYDTGVKARIEVTTALSNVAAARVNLIHAQNTVETSWLALNVAMGQPARTRYTLRVDPIDVEHPLPLTAADLLATAWDSRPELLGLRAQVRSAVASLRGLYANLKPTLSSSATYGVVGNVSPLLEYWSFGFNLSWPLFDGFQTRAQLAEAKASIQALEHQVEQERLQIYSDVETNRLTLEENRTSVQATLFARDVARQNFDLARQRYAVGLGSNLEFADAQVALLQAETNLVTAQNSYRVTTAKLAQALGVHDLSKVRKAPGLDPRPPRPQPSSPPIPSLEEAHPPTPRGEAHPPTPKGWLPWVEAAPSLAQTPFSEVFLPLEDAVADLRPSAPRSAQLRPWDHPTLKRDTSP